MNERQTSPQQTQKRQRRPKSDMPKIEQIRRRKHERRLRTAVLLVLVLAGLLAYLGGLLAPSINFFSNLLDSTRIALLPGEGWPVEISPNGLKNAQSLANGAVLLDESDLVLYSSTAKELRRIPHSYADPAVSVGGARVVLYNRGGTELRVESRSRTLLTKATDYDILTVGAAENGTFAVATKSERYNAQITVYDPSFNEVYYCYLAKDTPMHLAFTANGKRFAAACMDVAGGSFGAQLHLYNTDSEEAGTVFRIEALPLQMVYLSEESLLVVTDSFAAVYATADGTQTARYDYNGRSLLAADYWRKNLVLCFGNENRQTVSDAVVVDTAMQQLAQVELGYGIQDILFTGDAVMVLSTDCAYRYDLTGALTGTQPLAAQGEFLLHSKIPLCVTAKEILQLAY